MAGHLCKLRDGDEVLVTWCGGNGPHRYVVRCLCGAPHAVVGDVVVGELVPGAVAYCELLSSAAASREEG